MKLAYSISKLQSLLQADASGNTNRQVSQISTDSRNITDGSGTAFFALRGKREGYAFIEDAYKKGCRVFVIASNDPPISMDSAVFLRVPDVLEALQTVAQHHRTQFTGKVLGVTGSAGKTMVKEWLYFMLGEHYRVFRSPKSYNSQIGVALSLLELDNHYDFAILEAGISEYGEMEKLVRMIQPDYGLLTHMGTAHDEGFRSFEEKLKEKCLLFHQTKWVITKKEALQHNAIYQWQDDVILTNKTVSTTSLVFKGLGEFLVPFSDEIRLENLCSVLAVLKKLGVDPSSIQQRINCLPDVAMRMEITAGKNGLTLLNDSYNLDLDGFEQGLVQLKELAQEKSKIVVLAVGNISAELKEKAYAVIEAHQVDKFFAIDIKKEGDVDWINQLYLELLQHTNACILFKGTHQSGLGLLVNKLTLKHHQTYLEINRAALRNNLNVFRKKSTPETKLMVMVKASSYGSGSQGMAEFLEREGVDYLGVAYVDEGVELRQAGVKLPIFVMNPRDTAFDEIVSNELEPAIFSLAQLDAFVRQLIAHNLRNYPIHIKLETGMNRLGFREDEIPSLLDFLQAQPEVYVKSIYSHLAESDNIEQDYTHKQVNRFKAYDKQFSERLHYTYMRHICNTSGILHYPEAHFDMVRLGIGLYGLAPDTALQNALHLRTHITKINTLNKGESLGYNREHVAQQTERVAVLPIGYADGLRRLNGNGHSAVRIDGTLCTIVGNVCMDMCFVDVSHLPHIHEGAEVELFGNTHPISYWAKQAGTVPYEILTSISPRVNRIWVDE